MAECDWAILCDLGFQDIHRRACLVGIFDRISASAVPTLLPHATLVVKVLGSPEETCKFRIEIATESGPPLFTAEGNCTLSEAGWHNIIANFVNIVLPSFGSYSLNVYIEDYLSKATTFFVEETQPPSQQPA